MMEAGNENMNPKFNMPVHKPDPDLWNRIESEMDYLEMVETTNMNVKEMPVHSPAERVWQAIETRLPFIPYYRRSYFRVGMVMIAIILVSFLGWIISQLIIDISPEEISPAENTTIQPTAEPEETATIYRNVEADASQMEDGKKEDASMAEAIAVETSQLSGKDASTELIPAINKEPEAVMTEDLFPLAREKPKEPAGKKGESFKMASYRFNNTTSSTLMADEDEYFMPKRKKGHITLGAYTMPEYMHFAEGAPDNSALSSNYGMSLKYSWSTFFIETGLGYRQFMANSLYGINFSDLNLLGSVMLMEFQILQYYDEEGELVIEKIYKPTFVEVYDTSTLVVEENTTQRYSFIDVPIYFGKVLWSKNRYALAVKGGTRINIPLNNKENVPTPPPQDADIVTVEPMAVLASKFFVQFNVALENRIHFNDRGYISIDPMIGYHQQSIEYYNGLKRQSSWSGGLRVGIHYQLK
jgi:hypothetical protein